MIISSPHRCGVFLHSPFPSSEIFRTFPKREEILRSLLNADLIGERAREESLIGFPSHSIMGDDDYLIPMSSFAGFHTFDYARHFLSCCSRMLGLEHETSRGSIMIDYYGRSVGLKIMPTGEGVKLNVTLLNILILCSIWKSNIVSCSGGKSIQTERQFHVIIVL